MHRPRLIKQLAANERGTSAVEYGLVLALIVLAMLGAVSGFGDEVTSTWNNIAQQSQNATAQASA